MTSYIVNIDCFEDKDRKKLASHDAWSYESRSIAECAINALRFNFQSQPITLLRWGNDSIPEQYYPYVDVYMTTEEYLTVEEEANK